MTRANITKKQYGRLTVNETQFDLGFTDLPGLAERMIQTIINSRVSGALNIVLEVSESKLFESIMSADQKLEAEFKSLHSQVGDDEIYPGITSAQVLEAFESREYQDYDFYAKDPSKRIGADEEIKRTKDAYESKFPGYSQYFPGWVVA